MRHNGLRTAAIGYALTLALSRGERGSQTVRRSLEKIDSLHSGGIRANRSTTWPGFAELNR